MLAGLGFVAEKRLGSAWRAGSPAIAGILPVALFGAGVVRPLGWRCLCRWSFESVNQVLVRLWARPAAATDRMVVRFSLRELRDVLRPGNVFRGAYNVLSEWPAVWRGLCIGALSGSTLFWVVLGCASWGVDGSCAWWVTGGSPLWRALGCSRAR